jgi:hypothetical protein
MPAPYRICCIFPPDVKHYFWRDEQIIDAYNRPKTRPLFSSSVRDAHRFFQEASAIGFRDHFRSLYPRNRIFIESLSGEGPLFENKGVQPQTDSIDRRQPVFVEITDGKGFVVRPAITGAHGRCWCIRVIDVPSMTEHSGLESIYGLDPEDVIRRMLEMWATYRPEPFTPSFIEEQQKAEIRAAIGEIKNQLHPGRPRPGDL